MQSCTDNDDRNTGKDLLGFWIGYDLDFEIKYTVYHSKRIGIMFIRVPSDAEELIPERDTPDSIFVLYHGSDGVYWGCCWADRNTFLRKGRMNPSPMPPGKPVFGAHCSVFNRFETITETLSLRPNTSVEGSRVSAF
jgi:hypothetical protein